MGGEEDEGRGGRVTTKRLDVEEEEDGGGGRRVLSIGDNERCDCDCDWECLRFEDEDEAIVQGVDDDEGLGTVPVPFP